MAKTSSTPAKERKGVGYSREENLAALKPEDRKRWEERIIKEGFEKAKRIISGGSEQKE